MTEGRRGRWPFDASELIVFMVDVATVGHFASESTNDVRSKCFMLNNESERLFPTWRANCRCFVNQTSKFI